MLIVRASSICTDRSSCRTSHDRSITEAGRIVESNQRRFSLKFSQHPPRPASTNFYRSKLLFFFPVFRSLFCQNDCLSGSLEPTSRCPWRDNTFVANAIRMHHVWCLCVGMVYLYIGRWHPLNPEETVILFNLINWNLLYECFWKHHSLIYTVRKKWLCNVCIRPVTICPESSPS